MYSAERIYSAMILPIFMYCSSISLSWSHNCKQAIQNLEHRGMKIIASNQTSHSIDLQIPDVDSLIKKQACSLVFDCLNGGVCTPFKNYFVRSNHQIRTRNNNSSVQLPKVKLIFGCRSFSCMGTLTFNNLPTELRNLKSKVLFKKSLDEYLS